VSQRKCTDLIMCVFFLLFTLGSVGIGAFSLTVGNPKRLVYATDFEGDTCGTNNPDGKDLTSKTRAVYPRLNEDMLVNLQKTDPRQYSFYAICTEKCPEELDIVCNYAIEAKYPAATRKACMDDVSSNTATCKEVRKNCWVMPIKHTEVLFRCLPLTNVSNSETSKCLYPAGLTSASDPRCVLAEDDRDTQVKRPAQKNLLFDQLSSAASIWGRYFADVTQAWYVVFLAAIVLPLFLSFGCIKFLQNCTALIVWTVVVMIVTLAIVATFVAYAKAGLLDTSRLTSAATALTAATNGTALSLNLGGVTNNLGESANADIWRYLAYVLTGVTIILVIVLVAIRSKIADSINIITLGADSINAMPLMVFFPVSTVLALIAYFFWWVFVAANLMSAGTKEEVDAAASATTAFITSRFPGFNATAIASDFGSAATFTRFKPDDVLQYMQIYHFFALLWTTQFIEAISVMSIAGAVSAYYFSLDGRERHPTYGPLIVKWKQDNRWRKPATGVSASASSETADSAAPEADGASATGVLPESEIDTDADVPETIDGHEIPRLRLFRKTGYRGSAEILGSLWRVIRKHMGTAAFGALLIAIVQFIRAVMTYFTKQLDTLSKNGAPWLAYVKWYINYYLWLLEQCVKFVTRRAYIYTAIKGFAFCRAARAVFTLILRKTALLAFVTAMVDVIIFLAQLAISLLCGLICYAVLELLPMFQEGGDAEVFSSWLPSLVVMLFSYFVAAFFFNTFDVAVDTMLIAYVTDMEECKEVNGGVEVPLHYRPPGQMKSCCGCCSCCAPPSSKAADAALTEGRKQYDAAQPKENPVAEHAERATTKS